MFEKIKKYSLYNWAESKCTKSRYGNDNLPIVFWWICFAIIALIFLGSFSCAACSCDVGRPEEGYFSGYVTQLFDQKNVTWNSKIVEVKTGLDSKDKYHLCVNDDGLAFELETALRNKEKITLHFERDSWIMWNWKCNGASFIALKVEK